MTGDLAARPAGGHATGDAGPRPAGEHATGDLAARQAALVAALTSGAAVPHGFDERLVGIARDALLRKRAGEVARAWPLLAADRGDRWPAVFMEWAAARPTNGSLRDGWDLARSLAPRTGPAAAELAAREAAWRYDGISAPVPRGRLSGWARSVRSGALWESGGLWTRLRPKD
ncbi:hypothetical protein AB0J74_01050 [Asanoa sp. NPDC049573]|uniref:hypothetical protein n=1 Tax=Asanoa sp. NPDC049573 TaxID=3155396 RepID=UPI003421BD83